MISYGGRALRPAEKNYTISELECLAVIEVVKQYHPYLANNHFQIFTENVAL